MYGLSTVTGPVTEPVTTAEAKTHLRIDHSDDDTYIGNLITAARIAVENYLHRALITQTLKLTLDNFPGTYRLFSSLLLGTQQPIRLPRSPLQSISSIQYVDDQGSTQTLSASKYRVDTESLTPRIEPAFSEVWPSTRAVNNAVTVTFVAGYGDNASDVPEPIKQGIKLYIGTYYDVFRETALAPANVQIVPQAAGFILGPYRMSEIVGANYGQI